jgi:Flp pilus assembly pilin Flp
MNLMRQFWQDEAGVVVSTEIILVMMLLVFGLIAGMAALRDQVAQELADTGVMVGSLNQSYSFLGNTNTVDATLNGATPSSSFADQADENDTDSNSNEPTGLSLTGVAVAAEA